MDVINVMVNGLPGNVAQVIAKHFAVSEGFNLLPYSLTGPEIEADTHELAGTNVRLLRPDERDAQMAALDPSTSDFICVDFTHPSAVNQNAQFYCQRSIPFVMGTTGGDREQLMQTVQNSQTAAVIAPNMAKQIVGFQAMMAWAAENFPGLFKGYNISIQESHQAGKADTSGTAKAMVNYFQELGLDCSPQSIQKERDPHKQQSDWGIPQEHLGGHGWHTYILTSNDQSVQFKFVHNVNGREIYAHGTLDAVRFLHQALQNGAHGKVFSMMDVLRGDTN
jgi:4-hydroxy-tetrahydrodipicolinate reductase